MTQWVIQISMHRGTKLPWLGPRGQGFTLELWAVLLPSFAKRSLRAVHIATTKVKTHQPGRGGGQGGTKNIDALQHYSSSQSCSARRLNSFVQLLAGSCVLACDYVSYPVSCIDSPAACPWGTSWFSSCNFESCIIRYILSDIQIYIYIYICIYSDIYIYIQILSDHRVQIFHCDSTVSARIRPWTQMKLDKACPIFHSQGFDAGRQEARACRNPARSHPSVTICFWWTLDIKPLSLCQATSGQGRLKTGIQIERWN